MRLNDYEAPVAPSVQPADIRALQDDAVYTSAASTSPEGFKDTYETVLDELTRFGRSELTEKLRSDYERKQADLAEKDALNVLLNSNLTLQEKQARLFEISTPIATDIQSVYEGPQAGTPPASLGLGEEYINSAMMAASNAGSEEDKKYAKRQQTFLGNLRNTASDIVDLAKTMYEEGFISSITGTAEAGATIGTGLGTLIGAGYAGIWQVATKDVDKANATMEAIKQAIYKGDGRVYEAGMKVLDSLGRAIDIPFKAAGDATFNTALKAGASDEVASTLGAAVYAVPQAFGYTAGGYATIKAATKGASAVSSIKSGLKAGSPLPSATKEKADVKKEFTPSADRMWVKPNSPLITLEKVDPPYASSLIANAVKDSKVADALGTTPAGLILRNLLAKLSDDATDIPVDIFQKLRDASAKAEHYLEITKVDPWIFDPAAIKHDVALHEKIARAQNEVYAAMPASYVNDTGRAYRGKSIYGKTENEAFDTFEDALDASFMINREIKAAGKTWQSSPGVASMSTPKELSNGKWVVEWNFNRYYDPANFESMLLIPSAHFLGMDVTKFANSPVGKWLFSPATRLSKSATSGFARADIRGKNLLKVWEDIERKEILATKPLKELSDVIVKGDQEGRVYSAKELRSMYPNMDGKDFKSLLNGYFHYRLVDDQVYHTLNRAHKTQKITQGYTGLYYADGTWIKNLGRKVEPKKLTGKDALDENLDPVVGAKELIDEQGFEAKEVYDFTLKVGEDGTKGHVGVRSVSDVNIQGTDVYKLDKPVVIGGKEYQFGIGVREGAVPDNLLPRIPGHMPHINLEPYFIKAIPKELYINGRKVERDAPGAKELYEKHATTVGVAKTQKEADKYAAQLARDADGENFEYKGVVDRTDVDKGLVTYLDAVKLGADIGKSRKRDRLTHADGTLSTLEDPAVALRKRYQEAAKLDAFKDIDFEFRQHWIKRYGHLTDKKFPETMQDIKINASVATDQDKLLAKQARDMFEQYINFNKVQDSILDHSWREGMMYMAYKLEDTFPVGGEAARWAAKQKDPLFGGLLKLATVRAIHLNMQKQWFMQTSQLQELIALSVLNGNMKFPKDMFNLGPRILASVFADTRFMPKGLRNLSVDNLHRGTGMSKEEFADLVQAFKDTGMHNAIDSHAAMEGVLRDPTGKMVPTTGEKVAGVAETAIKAIPRTTKLAGFTFSELSTQIGMWLYSRSEFQRLNPKANMRNLHNRELIAEKALGVGNFMQTRGDVLPYQQGTLRAFLQFQAFTAKSAMQVLNSKYLTKEEKIRLAAIRAVAYGERGVLGAGIITQPVRDQVYGMIDQDDKETRKLVDNIFQLWERGAQDKAYNLLINSIINGEDDPNLKADIAFTEVFATTPEKGIPLYGFLEGAWKVWNGDEAGKDQIAAIGAVSALGDTAATFYNFFTLYQDIDAMDKMKTIQLIRKVATFAPMWNSVEKALVMERTGGLADKFGNSLDIKTAHAESWAQVLGIPSYKQENYYNIQTQGFKLQKDVEASAKNIVKQMHELEFLSEKSDQDAIDRYNEKVLRIQMLVDAWDNKLGVRGMTSKIQEAVMKELSKEENKGIDGPLGRLFKSRADKYGVLEMQMHDQMMRLRETSGTEVYNKLHMLQMELPSTNIDYEGKR